MQQNGTKPLESVPAKCSTLFQYFSLAILLLILLDKDKSSTLIANITASVTDFK